jgi:methylated-DNA-protein-cysteine methyltransferase related protein
VAYRADRFVMADSHWVDWVVRRKSKKSRPSPRANSPGRSSSRSLQVHLRIEAAIRRIPKGKVSTYGAVARAAGVPGAARLVARVLHRSFGLPWQRVLGAGGEIKLRGDHAIEQRLQLEAEGVRFRGLKVNMKACEHQFASAKVKRSKDR